MAQDSGSRGCTLAGQPGWWWGSQEESPIGGSDGGEWKVRSSGVPGQARPCNSVQQAPSGGIVPWTPQVGKASRKIQM